MFSKFKGLNETGRSMVEMLAVLAITAVLILASVWGYRYAFDVIMANRIVTGVRARSVVVGQQRVLGLPLDLKEFLEDGSDRDLIYGRFEVKAYNDYKNADASKYQAKVVDNCGVGANVQVMEVFYVPYDVCEHIKDLEFTDPTCNAINGDVYMARSGNVSYSVTCLPDQEAENPTQSGIVSGLDGVYQNVLTFVFDDGLGNRCNGTDDCPMRCCIEGVCSQKKICQDMECGKCEEKDAEDICVPKPKGTICTGSTQQLTYSCDGKGNCVINSSGSNGSELPCITEDGRICEAEPTVPGSSSSGGSGGSSSSSSGGSSSSSSGGSSSSSSGGSSSSSSSSSSSGCEPPNQWLVYQNGSCCCGPQDTYVCGGVCSEKSCCPTAALCVQIGECVNGQFVMSETSVCDLNGPTTIYAINVSFDANGDPYCPDCDDPEYANAHPEECCLSPKVWTEYLGEEYCCPDGNATYFCGIRDSEDYKPTEESCCGTSADCTRGYKCENGTLKEYETTTCNPSADYESNVRYDKGVSLDENGNPYCPDCDNPEYANAHPEECGCIADGVWVD